MGYVQLNDIYLNIFRMLIGRSVPEADIGANSFMPRYDPEKNPVHILSRLASLPYLKLSEVARTPARSIYHVKRGIADALNIQGFETQ